MISATLFHYLNVTIGNSLVLDCRVFSKILKVWYTLKCPYKQIEKAFEVKIRTA